MIVSKLQLSHVRAIQNAEFSFREGFNLLVGVNGVGKTTVLDALRICLSRVLRSAAQLPLKSLAFDLRDIRNGLPFLEASVFFDVAGEEFRYSRLEWREQVAKDDRERIDVLRREILEKERLRDRPRDLLRALVDSQALPDSDNFAPGVGEWRQKVKGLRSSPLGVFFATNRSLLTSSGATKSKSAGGKASAYANALVPRAWNIRELADWLNVQLTLAKERPVAAQHADALQQAATRFLPGCTGLRPSDGRESALVIEKSGTVLDVRQLSDGERGILAMVLDLARRLSQANEGTRDPLAEGRAVVLIDEIELHLHPKWQRQIIHNLQTAFPHCQFIATTHSPQVIGEVEHDRIQIIASGQVYSPTHSYGVDSSRVLEEVMDSASRTSEAQELISQASRAVSAQRLDDARLLVHKLEKLTGNTNDAEVTRLRTLLDFVEGKE
jgi:energy-coupling factor transporter ATP-binding protein EcfA2